MLLNLDCKDYRCAVDGTPDNQIPWAPLGYKCDYFHHCSDNYVCQSHRCVIDQVHIINTMKEAVNTAFKADYTESLTKNE